MVKSLRADKAFIGMNGIDPEGGVMTTPNLFEAQMKQAMIASAGKTYILADSSKIGRNFLSTVCRISDV